jgi:xanthine/CO dehydrogenase XdhC/CoxF family maturation factor
MSGAVVTIVRAEGSTYRRAGARMLVSPDGATEGSISGGCLEADAVERALGVMRSGVATLVAYDTRPEGDVVWGHGLGCAGLVEVLVEPADTSALAFVRRCERERLRGGVATVFRVDGAPGASVGARVEVDEAGERVSGVPSAVLAARMAEDAGEAMRSGRSWTAEYDVEEGRVAAFVEAVRPGVALVVFGAGHDAGPVVRIAREVGWRVTVVDHRPGLVRPERFPAAAEVVWARPEAARERVRIDVETAAVVMTHNYLVDLAILEWLLESPAFYVGALGPRRRADRLLAELGRDRAPGRMFGPAGLDIGAETPEEIALAIVAEAKAAHARRAAAPLRERAGAIHIA